MNRPEWMKFDDNDVPSPVSLSGERDDCHMGYEKGWEDAQTKLLKYQLAKVKAMKVGTVRTELGLWIESMLEQLEESK